MRAIEELKQLLDERGIEWDDCNDEGSVWLNTAVGRVGVWADTFGRRSCLTVNLWDYVYSPVDLVNLLFGKRSKAIIVSNGVMGHCRCESCGNSIDPWDAYCKYCGAHLVPDRPQTSEGAKRIYDQMMGADE